MQPSLVCASTTTCAPIAGMAASSTIQERIKKTGLDVIHPPSGLQVLAAIVMSWSSLKTSFPTVIAAVPVHWDTLLGGSKAKTAKATPFFFGEFQPYALKSEQVGNGTRRVSKQSRARAKPRQTHRRVVSEQKAKHSKQMAIQILQVVSLLLARLTLDGLLIYIAMRLPNVVSGCNLGIGFALQI